MSEAASVPPTQITAPTASAVVSPPDARMAAYLTKWDEKRTRMQQSRKRAGIWLAGILVVLTGGIIAVGELHPFFIAGRDFVAEFCLKNNISPLVPMIISLSVPALLLNLLMQAAPGVLVWWERKVAAHMQLRLGPMDVGGWHGWAQTLADGIKLLLKEIIEPTGVDKWVFRMAPVVVILPCYLSFAPLPFGNGLVALDFDIGLVYVLAVSGLSTIGILMAGWGSANKFSLLGGLRAAAQVVSFEIPRVLSTVPVVMWAGTLSLTGIAAQQAEPLGGWFPRWFIFYPIVGQISFIVYLITTIAETNRVPFDVPEAESELTAGFHTEYGGMKFAIFFMAEYAYVVVGSVLGATLFLGGGAAPVPFLNFIPSWAWLAFKTLALIFVFLWSRWTFPRLRVDRVMDLCWKIFIPWTLINILIAGFMMLWRNS
ncbi:MAG: NAD(P)H-quinone oxidoreductase subunit 1, chloroplastic [Elusimicrobia bacterium]|nr:NAD(P)H-quinone oxidoreductase subunit 1, chloroplastic [Elusimicrobiota bacterium]